MCPSDAQTVKTEYMKMSPLERWLLYVITGATLAMMWF
jgi:hypothetical protein